MIRTICLILTILSVTFAAIGFSETADTSKAVRVFADAGVIKGADVRQL